MMLGDSKWKRGACARLSAYVRRFDVGFVAVSGIAALSALQYGKANIGKRLVC